jgi:L-seryl-tRNA(Ser) seleniumtransferase
MDLPSRCVCVTMDDRSASAIEQWLRFHTPPIIGRIEKDQFIMDPRTLQEEELDIIETAFTQMLATDAQGR